LRKAQRGNTAAKTRTDHDEIVRRLAGHGGHPFVDLVDALRQISSAGPAAAKTAG
jgi:hypothetical protein